MDYQLHYLLQYLLLVFPISNILSWNYTEPITHNLSICLNYNEIQINIIMLNTIDIEQLARELVIPSGDHLCKNNSYNFWYYHNGHFKTNTTTTIILKSFGNFTNLQLYDECLHHISKLFARRNLLNITVNRCLIPDEAVDTEFGQTIEVLLSRHSNATTIIRLGKFQMPNILKATDNELLESLNTPSGYTFNCSILANILLNTIVYWSNGNRSIHLINSIENHSNNHIYQCGQCNAYEFDCLAYAVTLNATKARQRNQWQAAQRIVYALANDNVTIKCQLFDNRPQPSNDYGLLWFKHTDNRTTNDFYNFINTRNVQVLPSIMGNSSYFLNLTKVQAKDESWYTCLNANNISSSTYLKIIQFNHMKAESNPSEEIHSTQRSLSSSLLGTATANVPANHSDDEDASSTISLINEPLSNNKLKYLRSMYELHGLQENHTAAPQFKNVKRLEDHIHKPSGSSVQLMCPAIGNPTPNITWTRNNLEIQRTIGKVTYKRWYIQMDDATTEDSGIYKCTVCNVYGCIEHSTKLSIRDRLRSPPIISDKFPQNQTVLIHNSTYLECRVVSDLEPSIKWFKYERNNDSSFVPIKELESSALKYVNKIVMKNSTMPKVIALAGDPDRPSILNFTKVNYDDEGWYTCIASNTLGHTLESAYLRVVDKLMQKDLIFHGRPMWITSITIVVILLFLLGTIFIIYVLRKLKHEKLLKERVETFHQWTKKVIIYRPPIEEIDTCGLQIPVIKIEKQRTTFTTSSSSDAMQAFNEYEFPLDSNWEIPRNYLSLGSILGEGAFGRVVMAEANGLSHQMCNGTTGNTTIVAVKMVKEEHTDTDMTSLVHEMEVMKIIGKHINIINLLGCCSQNGPLWVIVEFAVHGNLKDFLKKCRSNSIWGSNTLTKKSSAEYSDENPILTEKHLTSFAFQIARGMEYLASRRCIHRDLAARNVLVSENLVMKIADFGLARDVQDTNYYRKNTNGRLPIKWMAPESLQDKFYDSKSDVWSYGVLLWEIMTYGKQPYPNIMSAEELYSYLLTGQRMEKPERCSLNIYMLMRQCWHFKSSVRPTFTEIVENLEKIIELSSLVSNEGYLNLSVPLLETPPSSSDDESTVENNQNQYHQEQQQQQQQQQQHQTLKNNYQYTYKFN